MPFSFFHEDNNTTLFVKDIKNLSCSSIHPKTNLNNLTRISYCASCKLHRMSIWPTRACTGEGGVIFI